MKKSKVFLSGVMLAFAVSMFSACGGLTSTGEKSSPAEAVSNASSSEKITTSSSETYEEKQLKAEQKIVDANIEKIKAAGYDNVSLVSKATLSTIEITGGDDADLVLTAHVLKTDSTTKLYCGTFLGKDNAYRAYAAYFMINDGGDSITL
ncbi:hypothetical protein [Lactovum odontotermitis]